jgi:hypothetical protein
MNVNVLQYKFTRDDPSVFAEFRTPVNTIIRDVRTMKVEDNGALILSDATGIPIAIFSNFDSAVKVVD